MTLLILILRMNSICIRYENSFIGLMRLLSDIEGRKWYLYHAFFSVEAYKAGYLQYKKKKEYWQDRNFSQASVFLLSRPKAASPGENSRRWRHERAIVSRWRASRVQRVLGRNFFTAFAVHAAMESERLVQQNSGDNVASLLRRMKLFSRKEAFESPKLRQLYAQYMWPTRRRALIILLIVLMIPSALIASLTVVYTKQATVTDVFHLASCVFSVCLIVALSRAAPSQIACLR